MSNFHDIAPKFHIFTKIVIFQRKIGKGNLYLTENWLSRNEMWCASDNHNNMCYICAKELLDSNFN